MKHFYIVLLMIIQVCVLSCSKNLNTEPQNQNLLVESQNQNPLAESPLEATKHIENNNSLSTEPQNQNPTAESRLEVREYFVSEQEIEKVKGIVQTIRPNDPIVYLARVDFGVPDGENWLVRFRVLSPNGTSFIYPILMCLINNEKISNYYRIGSDSDLSRYTQYDIKKDIPGTRMGDNSASAYGDYNDDGVVEVFQYGFGGNGTFVVISGYDEETDMIINYCGVRGSPDIPFAIIDPQNGPAPVEFMTYNGRYGFKAYFAANSVWPDPPSPDNYKWFFYAWDEEQKEYVNMGEVLER
jgi:hypothetical protein